MRGQLREILLLFFIDIGECGAQTVLARGQFGVGFFLQLAVCFEPVRGVAGAMGTGLVAGDVPLHEG